MSADYSAAGPLAGYLWQLRKALVYLLKLEFGQSVTLERHDDICVVRLPGEIIAAVQAKHSLGTGTITPRATELWKTLRVWAGIASGSGILPATLVLSTTHSVHPKLSALAVGAPDTQALDDIASQLDAVAQSAPNSALDACYGAWMELSDTQKRQLLSRVRIVASAANLSKATVELQAAVKLHHIPEADLENVARVLEGWFVDIVSMRLQAEGCAVAFDEVWEFLQDQHREYRAVVVPPEPQKLEEVHGLAQTLRGTNATFLRQLRLLDAPGRQLETAAHFYARARVARDSWLRQAAVARQQITSYVSELSDHWLMTKDVAFRNIDSSSTAEEQRTAGWKLHDACMAHSATFGRSSAPKYLTVGSYHLLADVPELGWHPEYQSKLHEEDDE